MRQRLLGIISCCGIALLMSVFVWSLHAQEQKSDPEFDPTVKHPAYAHDGPTIAIDEAHRNFHTAGDRYKPLADLLAHDGYRVVANAAPFERPRLASIRVLIVANAGTPVGRDLSVPAFTDAECDIVRDWVNEGGSLFLISDHAPFGRAVEPLARRFGVVVGKGWAFDRSETGPGITTQLVFTRETGLLGEHPIVHGRDASEEITRV